MVPDTFAAHPLSGAGFIAAAATFKVFFFIAFHRFFPFSFSGA